VHGPVLKDALSLYLKFGGLPAAVAEAATGAAEHTLRDYIELLEGGYFLFILYFWRAGAQTNSLSNEKKVYFADPLLHTIALEQTPGLNTNVPALVENAVGLALYRRYERPAQLIESFPSPDRLHVWRTARAGEIDFVASPRPELDSVEVKY
jgi:predicted AAA+ superfamily ATPase